jgi:putative tryptophan/tyrosine transport system substrate-binding protein
MAMLAYAAATKRWDVLTELVPNGTSIAVLAKPDSLSSQLELKELQPLWGSRGHHVNILNAANESEIDAAFAKLRDSALYLTTEALWTNRRDQIIALAARYAVPAIYPFREFVAAGGLASYGFNLADTYRQIGIYTGRILKGEKPADLPVVQPTKFELVINLKTAKALGISVPLTLQVAADDVIE